MVKAQDEVESKVEFTPEFIPETIQKVWTAEEFKALPDNGGS